jgi:hypothetical protein
VPQKEDLEIINQPGIQLMIKVNSTKEEEINQNPPLEENQSKQEMLSFFCQDHTEEEELLF